MLSLLLMLSPLLMLFITPFTFYRTACSVNVPALLSRSPCVLTHALFNNSYLNTFRLLHFYLVVLLEWFSKKLCYSVLISL